MSYDKILIIKHPARQVKLQEIAESDLVLMQYAHGGDYVIVRDGLGQYTGKKAIPRVEAQRLI